MTRRRLLILLVLFGAVLLAASPRDSSVAARTGTAALRRSDAPKTRRAARPAERVFVSATASATDRTLDPSLAESPTRTRTLALPPLVVVAASFGDRRANLPRAVPRHDGPPRAPPA